MTALPARTRPAVLDSGTSLEAAALQTTARTNRVKAVITSLLAEYGPLTDDELIDRYNDRAGAHPAVPTVTPQSIRTRRHELVIAGQVREADAFGFSKLGNRASTGRSRSPPPPPTERAPGRAVTRRGLSHPER